MEEFDWGETVQVSQDAAPRFRPGQVGWVVGKGCVDNPGLARSLDLPEGKEFRDIEFEDGEMVTVPVELLTLYE
jgi:hypothetical protein